jgi:hypothetical protein
VEEEEEELEVEEDLSDEDKVLLVLLEKDQVTEINL